LFFDQPSKHVPHYVGLFGIDFDPWPEPGLFGDIAIAIHPVGPWEKFILPRFVSPATPRPVSNLTAFVFGDHALHLG
jgi:hypothetical protein